MSKTPKKSATLTPAELSRMGDLCLLQGVGKKRLSDLLCNGLECGSYATFGVDPTSYVAPKDEDLFKLDDGDTDGHVYRHIQYPMSKGGSASLFCRYDEEEGEDGDRRFTLDLPALKRGLAILSLDYPRVFADWVKENDDALTGDALLQCALLGEVVYG